MSVSNPSLYRLLSASPFDLAPGESASERFNQHLRNQRRAATAAAHSTGRVSPSSRTTVPGGGGAAAAADTGPTAMQMPARSRICDQCGAIGGHTTACSAVVVSLGDIPVVERWCGKIVTLPGDADFPNTNTRPTNSTLYPGDSAGAGAAGMQGQAPHPVFDQCSCTQCRESRSTSTSRTAGGDGGGGAAATAASSAMCQACENTSTMTLVDLPEPLLVLICKDLGFQALCRVSQVSRAMYLAARDATLWRNLVLDPFVIPDEVLFDLCNRSAAINALSLVCHGSNGVTDAGIEAVAAQTTLTMLALQNCRGVSSQVMVAVLKNNRRLKHLNIKNCRQVTDSVLQAIGKHCPKLLTLNLMGCRNLTDAGLRELSTLDKITDLNLWGGGKWSDAVLADLIRASINKLKVLELRFCKQVTDRTITAIASNCDDIERLGLAYCTSLSDHALDVLLDTCPKLIWLNVRDCPQISTAARTRFMEKRPFCHLLFNKIV